MAPLAKGHRGNTTLPGIGENLVDLKISRNLHYTCCPFWPKEALVYSSVCGLWVAAFEIMGVPAVWAEPRAMQTIIWPGRGWGCARVRS